MSYGLHVQYMSYGLHVQYMSYGVHVQYVSYGLHVLYGAQISWRHNKHAIHSIDRAYAEHTWHLTRTQACAIQNKTAEH